MLVVVIFNLECYQLHQLWQCSQVNIINPIAPCHGYDMSFPTLALVIPEVEVTCTLGLMVLAQVLSQRLYIVGESKSANVEDIKSLTGIVKHQSRMVTAKNFVMHVHWSMSSFTLLVILEFCGRGWRMMHVTVAFWNCAFFDSALLCQQNSTTKNLGVL